MCTLVLAWHCFDGTPIAVAANRDEAADRPSDPPGEFAAGVLAPRDLEAGGTWIGVTRGGLVAAITNRWTDREVAGDRSRGLLVADVLDCESADEAIDIVSRETDRREYDAFNLTIADRERAVVAEWDGELSITDLSPGVHVVVNVAVDDRLSIPERRAEVGRQQAENARRVRRELTVGESEGVEGWLDRAGDVLSNHEYGVCVHGDGFGTRSSSLLAVGEGARYLFADGPPCRTAYERVDGAVEWGDDVRPDTRTDAEGDREGQV
ncbi:NRDE family protein [Saliphagus sp. LR7]|uniref:NRDE family protein n=1 Tax=Saliphagus sp. LR7 TaxID=2282654 RepID=UPI000DF7C7CA|nr:NRDE family protein [Saliphagus sp. LR7]